MLDTEGLHVTQGSTSTNLVKLSWFRTHENHLLSMEGEEKATA